MGTFKSARLGQDLIDLDDHIIDSYFMWLCNLVGVEKDDNTYYMLAKRLHFKEFSWFVPNDDNRAADGIKLRETFVDTNGLGYYELDVLEGPCSVLEMLIGLSFRINEILSDADSTDDVGPWFWEMVGNLGLGEFNDADYISKGGHFAVELKMLNMIERRYGRNGQGGLFPLRHAKKDQTKVEIWYQMNNYLRENYNVDC